MAVCGWLWQIHGQVQRSSPDRWRAHNEWIASLGENERGTSAQAELVAAWPAVVHRDPADPYSPPAWGVQVRNASELPIYQVHVDVMPIEHGAGRSGVVVEVLPPGDWLVSGRKIYLRPDNLAPHLGIWDMPERTFVVELRFTDTYGQTWHRDKQGILTRAQHEQDAAVHGPQSRKEQIAPEFEATVAQAVGPAMLILDRMNPFRVTMNAGVNVRSSLHGYPKSCARGMIIRAGCGFHR